MYRVSDMAGFLVLFAASLGIDVFAVAGRRVRPTYGGGAGVQSAADLTPREALVAKLRNLIAAEYQARSAYRLPCPRPLFSGAIQPRAGAFADSDAFLLRDGGDDRQDSVPERAATVEVLLGMRPPVDSERIQALKVDERFENALAGKAVEGPEQEDVEPALGRVPPHLLEPRAVRFCAGFFVDVLGDDLPALSVAELPELTALVIYFLAFALAGGFVVAFVGAGADTQVKGDAGRGTKRGTITPLLLPESALSPRDQP